MSNELATIDQRVPTRGVQHSVQDLMLLAKELTPTRLLPDHVKTPGQALAIMLAGQELGMQPMQSFRCLLLIKGKVAEAADSQLGRFKAAGGKATFSALTDSEAVLVLTHPNGDTHTERFSIADAQRARLTGGENWAKYPKAMLRSRVITAGLKSVGWDGASGAYDPDEAREINGGVVLPELAPMPVSASTAEQADAPGPGPISTAERRKIFAVGKSAGRHSEEEIRLWLSTLGYKSTGDITAADLPGILERLSDVTPLDVVLDGQPGNDEHLTEADL